MNNYLRLPVIAFGAVVIASLFPALSSAQDFTHVAGEGMIGDETLAAVADGGDLVAKVPNAGGTWSANGGEGVVSSSLNSPAFTVPVAGDVTLTFTHRYNFEDDGTTRWDAGAIFISVNGGTPTYVDPSAFTQNGYDGFGPGEDGRTITGNCPPIGAADPNGLFGFNNTSPGFGAGTLIESVANLGNFLAGDILVISFVGAWDEGFIQTPAPNWEIATFELRDSANGPLADLDFQQGPGGFAVTNVGSAAGPWLYAGAPVVVFEVNADTLAADRYVADMPGPSTFLDLNGANYVLRVLAGTLEVGDTFDLFEGGLMRGSAASFSLPEGQWDLSGLEPGGDGTITYASTDLSGWLVRNLDVFGGNGFEAIDTLPEAETFLTSTGTANIFIEGDRTEVRPVLDLGGGGGNYGATLPYPDGLPGTANEDFAISAVTNVVIPAGTWSIAIASDDGGGITVAGVDFSTGSGGGESRFGEDAAPIRPSNDTVRFEAVRGHSWTGGTFVLASPLVTTVTAIMFERAGGDSVEVAIRDASGGITNDPQLGGTAGWMLLADGALGWQARTGTTTTDRGEAIHVGGKGSTRMASFSPGTGDLRNQVFGPSAVTPGLTHEWWQLPNPGAKDLIDNLFDGNLPQVGPFKPVEGGATGTWWTGNGGVIPGVNDYPPATAALSRENYITRLTGEILVPESGVIRFKDGVDDYTYLAVDLNGNGMLGEADDGTGQSEILINDNTWTDNTTANNGGSPIASRTFAVDPGGEWLAIEFNTGEGGGGDSGTLYWDYDVNGGGLGAGVGFPVAQTGGIDLVNNAANLLIPESHLRSDFTELLSADIAATLDELPYEFEIAPDGSSDTLAITNPNPGVYTAMFDLTGARLSVLFTGDEPAPGTVAQLFDGTITGTYASLELPPGNWDTTGLEPGGNGTVVFLSGIPFAITDISYDAMANTATFTFNSKADHFYAVDYLGDGYFWNEITDSEASMGATTTYTDTTIPADTPSRIYRVRDLGVLP